MYDVFISYRRDGGSEMAILIRDRLKEYGITCFHDVESLRSGKFNEQLYYHIENSDRVVLVLPPHGLDRCADKDDWVRLELEHALKHNKTIIPVLLRGFEFPKNLPESLKDIPNYNGIEASNQYFDAMMKDLVALIKDNSYIDYMPLKSVDMRAFRSFANCGQEQTIFKIKKSINGDELTVNVNFEPTRLRSEIPEFAGIYYIFTNPLKAKRENKLVFEASSPDDSIIELSVEIKPVERKWMHESFQVELANEKSEYTIDFSDFVDERTLRCIEEITFVIFGTSFADDNNLKGQFTISNIRFE